MIPRRNIYLYIAAHDICDPKRWRKVFKIMNGYGVWVQLMAFQCRMSRQRRAELLAQLDGLMEHGEDHVVPIGPQADILRFCLIGDVIGAFAAAVDRAWCRGMRRALRHPLSTT